MQMVRTQETMAKEVQDLMNKVSVGDDTIRNLLEQLKKVTTTCTSASATDPAEKWKIKMTGSSTVSTEDQAKCSILKVKNVATNEKKELVKEYPESKKERYKVPYPPNVTSSTPAKAPSSSSSSSVNANTRQNSQSATPDTNDSAFWNSFFGFLKNQETKNEDTATKTNLNDAYDSLRKEVSTDKTMPGQAPLLAQPVQDPPKEAQPPPPQPKEGVWSKISQWFSI
jgi:hypothetical protein